MPDTISSLNNQRIKDVVKLNKRNQRDRRRVTIVEGVREIALALEAGVIPQEAYMCPELFSAKLEARPEDEEHNTPDDVTPDSLAATLLQLAEQHSFPLYQVTPAVFAKMAYRGHSGGILLVIPYLRATLADLSSPATPFYVVIEGVEKPGNLGAILRTADAAGVNGVIVCGGGTDIHNPNVIRASLGALFTVPVAEATTPAAIQWLNQRQIEIIVTRPDAALRYTSIDLTGPVAIVLGSEATGVTDPWIEAAHHQVSIPMFGRTNSLNLATSTALLLYETVRQRFK